MLSDVRLDELYRQASGPDRTAIRLDPETVCQLIEEIRDHRESTESRAHARHARGGIAATCRAITHEMWREMIEEVQNLRTAIEEGRETDGSGIKGLTPDYIMIDEFRDMNEGDAQNAPLEGEGTALAVDDDLNITSPPWNVVPGTYTRSGTLVAEVPRVLERDILYIHSDGDAGSMQADARMMAASPDLYEALLGKVQLCHGVGPEYGCDNIARWKQRQYHHTDWCCDACLDQQNDPEAWTKDPEQDAAIRAIAKARENVTAREPNGANTLTSKKGE